MAENFPGPFEVRINYSTTVGAIVTSHQHRFSLGMNIEADPGDPFDDWTPQGKLSVYGDTLDGYVDAYIAFMKAFFNTTTDIVNAELWEYEPGSNNAAFRSIYDLSTNGTSSTGSVQDGQMIVSTRTTLGGLKKFDFRETIFGQAIYQLFPTSVTPVNSFATFITAANTPLVGWDGGYVFSAYKFLPGLNEKATKKRLR